MPTSARQKTIKQTRPPSIASEAESEFIGMKILFGEIVPRARAEDQQQDKADSDRQINECEGNGTEDRLRGVFHSPLPVVAVAQVCRAAQVRDCADSIWRNKCGDLDRHENYAPRGYESDQDFREHGAILIGRNEGPHGEPSQLRRDGKHSAVGDAVNKKVLNNPAKRIGG